MTPPTIPIEQRFAAKHELDKRTGCWIWTAARFTNGYAQFRYSKAKNGYGHRFAYEHFVGTIPEGKQLHHKCGNRSCVNPEHLEIVTPREHVLEKDDTTARRNARKTHCKRGHQLSGDNLRLAVNGKRICIACSDLWRVEHAEERRTYAREYWRRRYREDKTFADKHRAQAREAKQRRRTGE